MGIIVKECCLNYNCKECHEPQYDCVAFAQKGWDDCHKKLIKSKIKIDELREKIKNLEDEIEKDWEHQIYLNELD